MLLKAFSMIEILLSVLIISIIASLSIMKFTSVDQEAILTKIKTDLSYIRSHIAKYENKKILMQEEFDLFTLDNSLPNTQDQALFSNIFKDNLQIISHAEKNGSWKKTNTTIYEVKINNENSVEFEYVYATKRFDCNMKNDWCIRLNQ